MKGALAFSWAIASSLVFASTAHAQWRVRAQPVGWTEQAHVRPELRAWAGATLAHLSSEHTAYAGGTLALGYESLFSVHPALNQWFYGSAFGVEARLRVLRSVGTEAGSSIIAAGLGYSSFVEPTALSRRVRFTALFTLLIPELGVVFRVPQPDSFSLRWSAPAALLVHPHVALEIAPALSMLTHAPRAEIEVLWELTIGVSWRQLGKPPRAN